MSSGFLVFVSGFVGVVDVVVGMWIEMLKEVMIFE